MKKDYIAVPEDAVGADEAAFVEQYWAASWNKEGRTPVPADLPRRDEYRIMRPFLSGLPPGSRILDGGCGLGEWTVFLTAQGFDVVGLDLSADVVATLQTRFPSHRFQRGDIRHTGFEPASFDAYLSWGAFEHFETGLGDCLTEAYRVLRPGGWLFVSVPFQNWRHILRDAGRLERWDPGFRPGLGYARPQRFYQWRLTRPELRRELEVRGFRTESVTPIHKLSGVGRWLQWDLPVFRKGTRPYFVARRVLSMVMPASYISHMILAVAQRR